MEQTSFDNTNPKESDFSLHITTLLETCFNSHRSSYITNIKEALEACSHVITLQKLIYKPKKATSTKRENTEPHHWVNNSNIDDSNSTSNHSGDEKTKKVNKIAEKLEQERNKLTRDIKSELHDILIEDFQTKDLNIKECWERNPREFKAFLTNKNILQIFPTFQLKISPQNFFQCLFDKDELNNITHNINHLWQDAIKMRLQQLNHKYSSWNQQEQEEQKRQKEAEKIKILKILGNISPNFLNAIKKKKFSLNIEHLDALYKYLWNKNTTKEINYKEVKKILNGTISLTNP